MIKIGGIEALAHLNHQDPASSEEALHPGHLLSSEQNPLDLQALLDLAHHWYLMQLLQEMDLTDSHSDLTQPAIQVRVTTGFVVTAVTTKLIGLA